MYLDCTESSYSIFGIIFDCSLSETFLGGSVITALVKRAGGLEK